MIKNEFYRAKVDMTVRSRREQNNNNIDKEVLKLEIGKMNNEPVEHTLAKQLGHNELKVREEGFAKVSGYLKSRSAEAVAVASAGSGESEPTDDEGNETCSQCPYQSDIEKVWKGLFYMMWHSDKLPVQDKLAKDMANLVSCVQFTEGNFEYFLAYVRAFFVTMSREWHGLDRYRTSKFLRLIRFIDLGGSRG